MDLALGALVRNRLRHVVTVYHILFIDRAAVIGALHGFDLTLQLLRSARINW